MKVTIVFFILSVIFSGCVTYYVNNSYLKGEWSDYVPPPEKTFPQVGNNITIDLMNDSFYYNDKRYTDIFTGDTCQDDAYEFASGKYLLKDNIINLTGYWTDSTYHKIKTTGCYNNGVLKLIYRIEIIDKETMKIDLVDTSVHFRTGVKPSTVLLKK